MQQKKRIEELDVLRGIAIFFVVLLHVQGYFYYGWPLHSVGQAYSGFAMYVFRFARQVFMFLTGFVLVYNYFGRDFHYQTFLRKRTRSVVVPYLFWSFFYVVFSIYYGTLPRPVNTGDFLWQLLRHTAEGDGYYHLYYVVVTVQFYLLFPLFLLFLRRLRHPVRWLAVGSVLYTAMMFWFDRGMNGGQWDPRHWQEIPAVWQSVVTYLVVHRDRLWFSYFGYYLIGAVAALYLPQWRKIINRFRWWWAAGVVLGGGILLLDYLQHVIWGGESFGAIVTVLKPEMFLYTVLVIAALYAMALHAERWPRWLGQVIRNMSRESFGMYLLHPFILFLFESYGLSLLAPLQLPVELQMVLTLAAGLWISYKISQEIRKIPGLSWMLGSKGDGNARFFGLFSTLGLSWKKGSGWMSAKEQSNYYHRKW